MSIRLNDLGQSWCHLDVLQRYDTPGLLVCRELKIVETVVIQDEPASLPALVASSLLPQPALLVWVEESVHQVIAIILGDLEGLRLDAEIITIFRLTNFFPGNTFTFHKATPTAPWGDSRHR